MNLAVQYFAASAHYPCFTYGCVSVVVLLTIGEFLTIIVFVTIMHINYTQQLYSSVLLTSHKSKLGLLELLPC